MKSDPFQAEKAMTNMGQKTGQEDIFNREVYYIKTLDDEIRADNLSQELLKNYRQYLLDELELDPLDAGSHARSADYFLRDYLIDHCRENIFSVKAEQITAFAGNWYIVSTLEPNMVELEGLLEGIQNFYSFCSEKKLIDPSSLAVISSACANRSFYRQRIESFHALKEDEFIQWNRACPLK